MLDQSESHPKSYLPTDDRPPLAGPEAQDTASSDASPSSPTLQRNQKNKLTMILLALLVSVLSFGLAAGVYFSKQSQDKRSQASGHAGDKYSMRERFGFGFATQICDDADPNSPCEKNLSSFPDYKQLGAGWYFDWSWGKGEKGGPYPGLEWLALVGGWNSSNDDKIETTICDSVRREVKAHPEKYPAGMRWSVGNEIGYDDGRNDQMYAQAFAAWKRCLKSIDPSFQVGTGAIIQPDLRTTGAHQIVCVGKDDYSSGYNYFKRYMKKLRQMGKDEGNESKYLPDFVLMHGYTMCNGASGPNNGNERNVELLKRAMRDYRQAMKEVGLQRKDLIIKEYSPLHTYDVNTLKNYMTATVDFLANAKDQNLGNPDDNYRLVQKWAWFVFNDANYDGDAHKSANVALFDKNSRRIKELGKHYQQLVAKYTKDEPTPTKTKATPTVMPSPTQVALSPTPITGDIVVDKDQVVVEAEAFDKKYQSDSQQRIKIKEAATASFGKYLEIWDRNYNSNEIRKRTWVQYSFKVEQAGNYKVYVRYQTPDYAHDSAYYQFDNAAAKTMWLPVNQDKWGWYVIKTYLNSGDHTLTLGPREPGVKFDVLVIAPAEVKFQDPTKFSATPTPTRQTLPPVTTAPSTPTPAEHPGPPVYPLNQKIEFESCKQAEPLCGADVLVKAVAGSQAVQFNPQLANQYGYNPNAPSVSYKFKTSPDKSGYWLLLKANGQSWESDSVFVKIDDNKEFSLSLPHQLEWKRIWVNIPYKPEHTITFTMRESGAILDAFSISTSAVFPK